MKIMLLINIVVERKVVLQHKNIWKGAKETSAPLLIDKNIHIKTVAYRQRGRQRHMEGAKEAPAPWLKRF